jgi:uncharacterized membrane protein
MSDQGWNSPGTGADQGGWGAPPPASPPPPAPAAGWGQPAHAAPTAPPPTAAPPAPDAGQWGQPAGAAPAAPAAPPAGQWSQPSGGQWSPHPQGQAPQTGGLDPKLAGILAYFPFGWLGGLVVYLVNKDELSRFQGAQSVLLGIAAFALGIASLVLQIILPSPIDLLFSLVMLVVWLGLFGLSIYLAIQGYNERKVVLPFVGPMAEQWARK